MTAMASFDWTKPEAYPDERPVHERIIDLMMSAPGGTYQVGPWFVSFSDTTIQIPKPKAGDDA